MYTALSRRMSMRIIITAGGTAEPIDDVRCITNRSTGRLGKAIAESLFARGGESIERLYYLHGPNASMPETPRTTLVPVDTVHDLGEALSSLLRGSEVSAIVHAMAVSDYRMAGTASVEALAQAVARAIASGELPRDGDQKRLAAEIGRLMRSALSPARGKIDSGVEGLALLLERTPKLIASLREAAPRATIVGFKLLCGSTEEELVVAGLGLLESARCSYVFANDARDAFGSGYAGFLLAPGGVRERLEGKEAIARRIADLVLAGGGGRA
jgi:phosphopantothenate---cysteine ligase (CTP)